MSSGADRHPALPADTLRIVEIHYYRVPRERWDLMILRARQSGANGVSSYIPWIHHEPTDGEVDLDGRTLPERDLMGFVARCREAGLGFIAKPGPFCDAEMLGGGVPTWLIDGHADWWAIRPDGRPHRHSDSYDPRLSYDSLAFQARAARWLGAVAVALRPFVTTTGEPGLWAWQIDNEAPGDGMLIHEDDDAPSPLRADFADVSRWRSWLASRYGTIESLNDAWGCQLERFEEIVALDRWHPPATTAELRAWLDLDAFADAQVASGLASYAAAVRAELGDAVPLFHDWLCMPWPLSGMLVEPGVLADTCGWVGQNVYAEDVDPAHTIAGTQWYKMDDAEYVHHAWWRTRLCHTLSPPGLPHLVPEISARQAFYLQCSLVGGMDAPCIYMLHSSAPEPPAVGAFERWAEEAPVLPDGSVFEWWWNLRCLFACLEAGGADLASSPLPLGEAGARTAIAYDHAGERAARYCVIPTGEGPWTGGDPLARLCAAANTSAHGITLARALVDAGQAFDVVDAARHPLDGYDVIVVPPTSMMSRAGQSALQRAAALGTAQVLLAGAAPSADEHGQPCAWLADLPPYEIPRPTHRGVDVSTRVGASGRRYVTVVNRSRDAWAGTVEGTEVGVGPASVTWYALEFDDTVLAALLHGDGAVVGELSCSQGQAAIVRTEAGWHTISQERASVGVPPAAGAPLWRITLAGQVHEVGTVADDGRFRFVHQDDLGQTDRYVAGDRAEADRVAEPVRHFVLSTLAEVAEGCEAVGVEPSAVTHRLRRIRSAMAAGSATDEDRDLVDGLTRLASRMNDLRLGAS